MLVYFNNFIYFATKILTYFVHLSKKIKKPVVCTAGCRNGYKCHRLLTMGDISGLTW